jgi:hypothetical protein
MCPIDLKEFHEIAKAIYQRSITCGNDDLFKRYPRAISIRDIARRLHPKWAGSYMHHHHHI